MVHLDSTCQGNSFSRAFPSGVLVFYSFTSRMPHVCLARIWGVRFGRVLKWSVRVEMEPLVGVA